MSIKKYIANKDTTITNAFMENMITRGINSNMGASDSLEVFTIYGQVTTSSLEKTRLLVQFPVDNIASDRVSGSIPASGSVSFYLRLYNVVHPFSVPRQVTLSINPLSKSWEEGYGLDMEGYTDKGYVSDTAGYGSTWMYAASGSAWVNEGGDYLTSSGYDLSYYLESGLEDIEMDITSLTEQWLTGSLANNGLIVRLSSSLENGSRLESFYTKKFSARGSEFYMRRPCIEARWDPSITDDRNNFFASSSLVSAEDNKMSLYFYNKVNGRLKNIAGNPTLSLQLFTNSSFSDAITASYNVVSNPLPGVYKAQVAIDTTSSVLYDKWVNSSSASIKYFSGSFDVNTREGDNSSYLPEYIYNITNLKNVYDQNEKARFNIFVRERDWQPTIYTVAYNNVENTAIPNLYYKIFRFNDNYTVVDYSTGSLAYTKTSYDSNGNYFELDMNILEKDYGYGIKLATWDGVQLAEYKDVYKFRIR